MNTDRALESDIDLEQDDAEGVKGGGIPEAEVRVGGVGSASVQGTDVTASALGASATNSSGGWSAGAKRGSTSAKTSGRHPRVKRRPKK